MDPWIHGSAAGAAASAAAMSRAAGVHIRCATNASVGELRSLISESFDATVITCVERGSSRAVESLALRCAASPPRALPSLTQPLPTHRAAQIIAAFNRATPA